MDQEPKKNGCACGVESHCVVHFTIRQLAEWLGAPIPSDPVFSNTTVQDIWMDSRKISPGDLFIALEGEERDGHDFIVQAFSVGAYAAIAAESKKSTIPEDYHEWILFVDDPLKAIQVAAKKYREALKIPVIAITGSNGKTSTAQFIKKLLSIEFEVGGTVGNWNNHIGVPLSILRLRGTEEVAVFELGANHAGEIAPLAEISDPDIAVITNIGYAHVGNFGSLEVTAQTKFELADHAHKRGALLLLNGDDEKTVEYNAKKEISALYFGTRDHNAICAEDIACDSSGCYSFTLFGERFTIPMPGKHFIYSILPALFVCRQMGMSAEQLRAGVTALKPESLRGEIEELEGINWIIDCYNANPSSMKTSLDLLADIPSKAGRGAVLGTMGELGDLSEELHRETGAYAATKGLHTLVAVGPFASSIIEGALEGGMERETLFAVESTEEAEKIVRSRFLKGDNLLLKGSRSAGLESLLIPFGGGEN